MSSATGAADASSAPSSLNSKAPSSPLATASSEASSSEDWASAVELTKSPAIIHAANRDRRAMRVHPVSCAGARSASMRRREAPATDVTDSRSPPNLIFKRDKMTGLSRHTLPTVKTFCQAKHYFRRDPTEHPNFPTKAGRSGRHMPRTAPLVRLPLPSSLTPRRHAVTIRANVLLRRARSESILASPERLAHYFRRRV